MAALTKLSKIVAICIALASLAACRPAHVHQSYQETYVPAYRTHPAYVPSYSVQYYSTPAYVESRTVVVPRVVVAPPRTVHADDHRPHQRFEHRERNHLDGSRHGNRGNSNAVPLHRAGGSPNPVLVTQQNRITVAQPAGPRDDRKDHRPDRRGPHGKND